MNYTKGQMENVKCPNCSAVLQRGSEPVTVGGVYGDFRITYGKVGGVHTCQRTAIICHACGKTTNLPNPFDEN